MISKYNFPLLGLMVVLLLGPINSSKLFAHTDQVYHIDSLRYAAFGKVTIYKPTVPVKSVVLFLSGDGGWNSGVVEMAKKIAAQGALVAGIDIRSYYKELKTLSEKCYYPAGDFEQLSIMVQKKYQFNDYLKPILIGYSSGATLVYGILAQAPANTFKGAVSLGFCPDIEIDKPLCGGAGLKSHAIKEGKSYYLEASDKLTAPFILLIGFQDQICPFEATKQYMKGLNTGQLIELPKVGHGFSVMSNWLPQFIGAYKKVLEAPLYGEGKNPNKAEPATADLTPLPVNFPIVPISAATTDKDSLPLVFLISGDGGWTSFVHDISESLVKRGIPVVGLDAQKYFWKLKTPEETSAAIAITIQHYMLQWNRKTFVLAGYSFGACLVPFIANRLPDSLKKSIRGVIGLSPDKTADFEIHLGDMMGIRKSDPYQVPTEVKKIKQLNPICIFGDEEDIKLRNILGEAGAKIIVIPGNHHYNNKPDVVAESIFKEAAKGRSR